MAKYDLKIKAQNLREKGLPMGKIAKRLKISKGSVSLWCRDIKLSEKLKDQIKINHYKNSQKGRLIGAQMNKKKRLTAIKNADEFGIKNINKLNRKEVILIATALYWSEGSKSESSSGFRFVNSDPSMILFIRNFLINYMDVKNSELTCSIQINQIHKPRIGVILNFWKNLLRLEDEQIRKPYFVSTKSKKIYKNFNNYYGICKLIVRKSTNLKYIMLGFIKAIKSEKLSM